MELQEIGGGNKVGGGVVFKAKGLPRVLQRLRWNQTDLAEALGVSRQLVSRMVRQGVTMEQAMRIVEVAKAKTGIALTFEDFLPDVLGVTEEPEQPALPEQPPAANLLPAQIEIIARIDAFMEQTGFAPTTLGEQALGDPKLYQELKEGRALKVTTLAKLYDFMRLHEHVRRKRRSWVRRGGGSSSGS